MLFSRRLWASASARPGPFGAQRLKVSAATAATASATAARAWEVEFPLLPEERTTSMIASGAEADQPSGPKQRLGLHLGHHAPAQSGDDGVHEPLRGGHEVPQRARSGPPPRPRTNSSWRSSFRSKATTGASAISSSGAASDPAPSSTPPGEGRRGHREIAHATQGAHGNSPPPVWPRGHRRHHHPLAQQGGRAGPSSRRSSKQSRSSRGTRVSAGRNQVASESAFTAIDSRVGSPASLMPSSVRASRSSRASRRANRTTTSPDSVARTGFVRISRTRPMRCSSALTRWLTAEGVTCRAAAAASRCRRPPRARCVPGREGDPTSQVLMIRKNL